MFMICMDTSHPHSDFLISLRSRNGVLFLLHALLSLLPKIYQVCDPEFWSHLVPVARHKIFEEMDLF